MKKHKWYYIVLLTVLLNGLVLGMYASYDRQLQVVIFSFTAFCYVSFSLIHHIEEHNISSKIVIEYVLIGSFGLAMLLFLTRLSI